MASIPKHPFWECVFKWLEINKNFPVLDAAGPYMLMCAIREEPHNVNSLESKLFAPEIKTAWDSQSKFIQKIHSPSLYWNMDHKRRYDFLINLRDCNIILHHPRKIDIISCIRRYNNDINIITSLGVLQF